MPEMTKRERIQAALAGKRVDRPPVAFWRHFPGEDQSEDGLVQAALDFQTRYDLDFIKLPVSSTFTVSDYGVKHEYRGALGGDRTYVEGVVKKVSDWERIVPLDVRQGTYGWHLQALRRIIRQKPPATPVVVTMFHPLALAFYLAGQENCLVHLRTHPDQVEPALKALTTTCADFARAVIQEGADGIFFSARFASYEIMSEEEYTRFARPGDAAVLSAAAQGWFNILHVHGPYPMVDLLADLPAQALNWHDRTAFPKLADAAHIFKGALMGGVDQHILQLGTPQEVAGQVANAIKQMSGRRLIVSPGCTYSLDVSDANLQAMRKAVTAK
ncbi:MAG TPA: uroporphyrinogen decarboxylase family protein [Dehalococcoidales bacterium]